VNEIDAMVTMVINRTESKKPFPGTAPWKKLAQDGVLNRELSEHGWFAACARGDDRTPHGRSQYQQWAGDTSRCCQIEQAALFRLQGSVLFSASSPLGFQSYIHFTKLKRKFLWPT
jgi:hypothetical protein